LENSPDWVAGLFFSNHTITDFMTVNITTNQKRFSLWSRIFISAILTLAVVYVSQIGVFWKIELKSYDSRFKVRGSVELDSSDIALVVVDEKTFENIPEKWPYPRSYYANAIENLFTAGARLIVFDIRFTDPSADPLEDSALAAATVEYADRIIHAGRINLIYDDDGNQIISERISPIQSIRDAGANYGIANVLEDEDGYIRQYLFYIEHDEKACLPLAFKALQVLEELPDSGIIRNEVDKYFFGEIEIPKMTSHSVLINYSGPSGQFPTYSFCDVLDDSGFVLSVEDQDFMRWYTIDDQNFEKLTRELPKDSAASLIKIRKNNPFRDKIIFIGGTNPEFLDLARTPFFSEEQPDENGVILAAPAIEVHAHALQTFLSREFIKNSSPWLDNFIVFFIALTVLWVRKRFSWLISLIITILLAFFTILIIYFIFIKFRIWMGLVAPLMSLTVSYIGSLLIIDIRFRLVTVLNFLKTGLKHIMAKDSVKGQKRVSLVTGLVGSVVLAILVYFVGRLGFFWEMELKTYDARFNWRGPVSADSSNIVVIAIDDETYSTLPERWPFPRSYFARMIDNLFKAGARLVILDVQFTEPSADPTQDSILAAVTAEYADKVIHAGKIVITEDKRISKALERVIYPIDTVKNAGAHFGIVNYAEDRDGFLRQYQLFWKMEDKTYLTLAMKALQILEDLPDTSLYTDIKPNEIQFGGIPIKLMTPETMLINFVGPAATFPTYSLSTVLDDAEFDLLKDDTDYMQFFLMSDEEFAVLEMILPEESVEVFRQFRAQNPFKDKIVFLGASIAELHDNKKTPFYTYEPPDAKSSLNIETPGVEVHANALHTLLTQNFVSHFPPLLEIVILFFLTFGVYFISNYTKLILGTLVTILLAVGILILSFYIFTEYLIWVALVPPLITVLLAYVATTAYRFFLEQKDKAMIRGMFAQYVPKKVVEELINNPDLMALGGERRRMTALFTDVAGFTSVSEKLTPDQLVHLLNEYLSEMSKIILDNEGIIDKYEGDLIMAEWGAPVFFEDHATWGCRAALKMQVRLAELREHWKETGEPILYSRVGVNTGDMIVGNMGCLEVFDYTVMGDAVNLASRLEGANKSYESTIMIGPETFADLPDNFVTRMLDDIQVKGKQESVRVYELLAEFPEELPDEKHEVLKIFDEGMEHYREKRFIEGKKCFENALEIDPEDGPSKTYHGRCEHYIDNPPPEDWDRVYVLTEK